MNLRIFSIILEMSPNDFDCQWLINPILFLGVCVVDTFIVCGILILESSKCSPFQGIWF